MLVIKKYSWVTELIDAIGYKVVITFNIEFMGSLVAPLLKQQKNFTFVDS